jgi:hypothetical protein
MKEISGLKSRPPGDLGHISEIAGNGSGAFRHGLVIDIDESGRTLVSVPSNPPAKLLCHVLDTGAALNLGIGDTVLILPASAEIPEPVILGRIGTVPAKEKQTPDELVLEAKKNLTIKCGDGSITIRADGKVLIKGQDLVSHAKRSNRVKGGSVSIN